MRLLVQIQVPDLLACRCGASSVCAKCKSAVQINFSAILVATNKIESLCWVKQLIRTTPGNAYCAVVRRCSSRAMAVACQWQDGYRSILCLRARRDGGWTVDGVFRLH